MVVFSLYEKRSELLLEFGMHTHTHTHEDKGFFQFFLLFLRRLFGIGTTKFHAAVASSAQRACYPNVIFYGFPLLT